METMGEETQKEGAKNVTGENSSIEQELASATGPPPTEKAPAVTTSTIKTPATLPSEITPAASLPTSKTPAVLLASSIAPVVTVPTDETPPATESTATTRTATAPKATAPKATAPTATAPTATAPTVKASSPHTDPPKKSKREDRNKRDDDYVKQFIKAINTASTLEEKMQISTQRYTHMVDDNKKMQFYIKQAEKRHALVMKEKDQLQLEYNKTILVKSKLENLCRELQKQNKTIKEESLLKIREEEERRKETQNKFQNTLTEITALLQQNTDKNAKLRDDNISMTEKLKNVVTQYQLREQQVDKMAKQMSLEQQLADAKFMKAKLEHQAEKERLLAEMEGLKVSVQQHRARLLELQGTESGLRSQLAVYTDKYDEFQNALVKSNQVFGGFKEEMEKMSKKIKKLEKESVSWKKRWELSQSALLDMCGERQSSEERAACVARQLHNMQSLCRTLQAERTMLLNILKENNIERPPLTAPVPPPPAPAPAPGPVERVSNAKVDAMAANCAQLRQSLAHLQSQLNVLTHNKEQQQLQQPLQPLQPPPATPEETPKPKKSKSKKSKKHGTRKETESAKESATESANEDKAPKVAETAQKDAPDVPVDVKPKDKDVNIETADKVENIAAKDESINIGDDKVDDKTLESLIQAINNANINLIDLEVVGDDKIDIDDVLDVDSLSKDDEVTKSTDTASNDVSEIETSNKESSNEDSPINGPNIDLAEVSNGLVEESKIDEVSDEIPDNPNIVEITDEIASRPKIIELPDDYETPKSLPETSIGVPEEKLKYLGSQSKAQKRNA